VTNGRQNHRSAYDERVTDQCFTVFIAAGALEIGEFKYPDIAMVGLVTLA
jgi:hypothetical protein